ncbi:F0F1 ATP synthase subunit epsilon [Methylocystis sp. JAN1]|uniref:F0F1 ATP synthase subunit epsilon n=1 Tax=Methylocystis sp. JAN1 TaxID=3397211 RepID=UPI003FA1BC68
MTSRLRLVISTPTRLLVDEPEAASVRGEDASGAFGILPGHANFVTALSASVLRWRVGEKERYCAVRGGVMSVKDGLQVSVACRHGVLGDELEKLEADIRAAAAVQAGAESRARVEQTRLHAYAVRQLVRYLRPAGLSDSIIGDGQGEGQ